MKIKFPFMIQYYVAKQEIDKLRQEKELLRQAIDSIEWTTKYLDGSKDHARIDRALVNLAIGEET